MQARHEAIPPGPLRVVGSRRPGVVHLDNVPLRPVDDDVFVTPDRSYTSVVLFFRTADLHSGGQLVGCGRCPVRACVACPIASSPLSRCHFPLRGVVSRDAIVDGSMPIEVEG